MYQQKTNLLIASTIALTLTACATIEEKMTAKGATRLNAEQVKTHIVGNTEKWTKGGGYYNSNGILETVWKGASQSGPYEILGDGKVCYEVKTWSRLCHFYMNDSGTITMIYKGKNVGEREIVTGNQLSSL